MAIAPVELDPRVPFDTDGSRQCAAVAAGTAVVV